jgi:hypothetical protein
MRASLKLKYLESRSESSTRFPMKSRTAVARRSVRQHDFGFACGSTPPVREGTISPGPFGVNTKTYITRLGALIFPCYTFTIEYPFPPVGVVGAADSTESAAHFLPNKIRAHTFDSSSDYNSIVLKRSKVICYR